MRRRLLLLLPVLVLLGCSLPCGLSGLLPLGEASPFNARPTTDINLAVRQTMAQLNQTAASANASPQDPSPSITQPLSTPQPAGPTPNYTPTPDNRLPPERWSEWPIAPTASGRARDIYRQGLAQGNDPAHFSKLGDCHSINEVFLAIYDSPDVYRLPAGREDLAETVHHFSGSFSRESMAVNVGLNDAAALSPMWADPEYCESSENPLTCELGLHKPAFLIISLEAPWDGRTPAVYEGYLRQIVEITIAHGTVPILATKADNLEGGHAINATTARIAYEYDLPLWNFWRAVQDLDDEGIDLARDNFHLTVEAWNRRSFTALAALDSVWRGVRDITLTPVPPTNTHTFGPPSTNPIHTASPTSSMTALY